MSSHRLAGKYDRPRHVGHPARQLRVNEIAEAPAPETEGHAWRDEIGDPEKRPIVPAPVDVHTDKNPQHSTVKRHAAFPDSEQRERIVDQHAKIVEQHVADPAAENDPQHAVKQQIGYLLLVPVDVRSLSRGDSHRPPGKPDPREITDGIPMDADGPDADCHRIDVGVTPHYRKDYCLEASAHYPACWRFDKLAFPDRLRAFYVSDFARH